MIQVQNISFRYPGTKTNVFRDFSMDIKSDRIYGLLGKNGTGKSTLLYIISGLLTPSSGMVSVDGMASKERHPALLRDIFIVPEEFELPNVSLKTYIKSLLPFYPNFSQNVLEKCLHDFELPDFEKLSELSMGQKKKVYMSVALAANTRYLLMDEPTNGLDIPSKSQFRRVVADNMTDGRTIIISTHQVHDVESLLDHILILTESKMLLDATTAEICEKYSFEYRSPQQMDDMVVYAEPTLQGNAVIARRNEGDAETVINLELLFNAVCMGKLTGKE